MSAFLKCERGIAATLALVLMPALILFTVVLIDIGRGNNSHSDLQAAADALALAGARELDGGVDAITRAQDAMDNFSNNVHYLGQTTTDAVISLQYGGDGGAFTVTFLTDIPDSDDTPIDAAFLAANATTDGLEAEYVHVRAQSQNLSTTGRLLGEVPVAAVAVATYATAACNVTPLFICNPFETEDIDLQEAFADGQLHGRLLRLHPSGSGTAMPGNFGFLQVTGANDNSTASANAIRRIFAGDYNPTCYEAGEVTTKPGAAVSIAQGINVRFDIYVGPFSNRANLYVADVNVRKGYVGPGNACNRSLTTDFTWAQNFPDNEVMSPPGSGAPGAYLGSGDWDIDTYWQTNFQTAVPAGLAAYNSFPSASSPASTVPSRYDVYRYEIDNGLVSHRSIGQNPLAPDNKEEVGTPICSASQPGALPAQQGRRLVFAAMIDCLDQAGSGATTMDVNSYASLFMTRPMESGGSGTIDVEVVDITGYGGNGTLDDFVRDEALLVR